MRISAIIPTYNRAQSIAKALDSVYAQTYAVAECIVIDDGSTDDTANIVRQNYPQVTYLHQAQQGVSAARNRGIKQASGEWLAFLDSDDEWLSEKLSTLREHLQRQPNFRLIHSDEIWIRHGVRVNPMKKHKKYGGDIYEHCLPLCCISPSAVMIERSLFDQVGMFDESLPACEDYDLWLRICCEHPVLYVDQTLIKKYGGHDDQLSKKHWGMDRFRIQALEKILKYDRLDPSKRLATVAMLIKKLDILAKGAEKHQNQELLLHCQNRLLHYQQY